MSRLPVVVAVDGSEESLRAAEWAAREAMRRTLPLRIVSAPALLPRMQSEHVPAGTVANALRDRAARSLALAVERVGEVSPGLLIDADLLSGPPAVAVSDSGSGASMLVVGARGSGGFGAMLLGSVSRYAAGHASCPVVVVREDTTAVHREVAVGIRDPEDSQGALGFAFEEAALRGADLLVVHAWHWIIPGLWATDDPLHDTELISATARAEIRDMLSPWGEKYPSVQVISDVVHAHPAQVLASLSARADLVVIGRHATSGPVVGSIQNVVLSHAHGPVAIVPGGMR